MLLPCLLLFLLTGGVHAREWRSGAHELCWSDKGPAPQQWSVQTGGDGVISLHQPGAEQGQLHLVVPDHQGWTWSAPAEDGAPVRWRTRSGDADVTWELTGADADYRLQLTVRVTNDGEQPLTLPDELRLHLGPGMGETPVEGLGIAETLYSFAQPVLYQGGELHRFDPDRAADDWLVAEAGDSGEPRWGGLQSRYFALLLQPLDASVGDWRVRTASPPGETGVAPRYLPRLAIDLPLETLAPDATHSWTFEVFAGPKARNSLAAAGADRQGYEALLFPGLWQWMRVLAFALLWLLGALHAVIPSWGLAIIALAVLVRLAMYPVARRALRSQAAFAEVQKIIQPEMKRIKREYRGAEQSERILDLYSEHGVSPLAGMKPLLIVLIQLPVFVALFHVLGQAWELREAGFLWIDTLAEPDRLLSFGVELPFLGSWFNLLPVLMALTTLATIRLSPAPAADDRSRRLQTAMQVLMALAFLLLFYPFPAGMVLYWTMANVLHLLQQGVVERWSGGRTGA
ncbi:MAG: YidC/Oxa1 family insertase periplasmic-domain containing protein [Pseudohongiellaceae bacterium]